MITNLVKLLSTQMKRETKIIKEVNTQDALLNIKTIKYYNEYKITGIRYSQQA